MFRARTRRPMALTAEGEFEWRQEKQTNGTAAAFRVLKEGYLNVNSNVDTEQLEAEKMGKSGLGLRKSFSRVRTSLLPPPSPPTPPSPPPPVAAFFLYCLFAWHCAACSARALVTKPTALINILRRTGRSDGAHCPRHATTVPAYSTTSTSPAPGA